MGNFMLIMWKALFDLHIYKVSENWMRMKYWRWNFIEFFSLSVGDLNAMKISIRLTWFDLSTS